MDSRSVALVLLAAVLHASWNLVVKDSRDRLIASWANLSVGGVAGSFVLVGVGLPAGSALPWLVASAVTHVGYLIALAKAYDAVDMAVAYPLARGVAPPVVAVLGIVLLGDSISAVGVIGIVLVAAGVTGMVRRSPSVRDLGWPLATGAAISTYSFLDAGGVRSAGAAAPYIASVFVLSTIAMTLAVVRLRSIGAMRRHIARAPVKTGAGGLAGATAYLLVLVAARTNPVGLVAGLRETSAMFGVFGARVWLREPVSRSRLVMVATTTAGATLIALS